MQDLVQFAKALSDPTRARILAMLGGGEACVCEIVDVLAIPQSSLSTHLQALRQAGVVRVTKRATWAYYSIADSAKPIVEALGSHFGWDADPSVIDARARLQARLAMRECDCCARVSGN